METAEEELLDLLTCHRSESCPEKITALKNNIHSAKILGCQNLKHNSIKTPLFIRTHGRSFDPIQISTWKVRRINPYTKV